MYLIITYIIVFLEGWGFGGINKTVRILSKVNTKGWRCDIQKNYTLNIFRFVFRQHGYV